MPSRRPIITRRSIRSGSREIRIKIPQPTFRPVQLDRQTVRKEFIRPEAWWFVLHRRGVYRPTVGVDPEEARAVQNVRGTLPERIVFKALLALRFRPGYDFDFQSSLQGGRLELGGLVADFLFPSMRTVLRVQGPSHTQHIRHMKDEEQRLALEAMGFWVHDIDTNLISSPTMLYNHLRNILLAPGAFNETYNDDLDYQYSAAAEDTTNLLDALMI